MCLVWCMVGMVVVGAWSPLWGSEQLSPHGALRKKARCPPGPPSPSAASPCTPTDKHASLPRRQQRTGAAALSIIDSGGSDIIPCIGGAERESHGHAGAARDS